MDPQHNTHDQGRSIWKVINILFALAFTVFTVGAGTSLILGGIRSGRPPVPVDASAAPAAPAAASTAAAATGTAPATPGTAPATPGAAPVAPAGSTTTAPADAPPAAGVAAFTIKPGAANPMTFDITSITVKKGQKVKITFSNDSNVPLQHNLILCKAGSKDRMIALANTMMTDMTKWMALGFVPDTEDVIAHTKLLNHKESETIEFTAPAEAGDYPYLCTFPGHSMMMNGVMKVE